MRPILSNTSPPLKPGVYNLISCWLTCVLSLHNGFSCRGQHDLPQELFPTHPTEPLPSPRTDETEQAENLETLQAHPPQGKIMQEIEPQGYKSSPWPQQHIAPTPNPPTPSFTQEGAQLEGEQPELLPPPAIDHRSLPQLDISQAYPGQIWHHDPRSQEPHDQPPDALDWLAQAETRCLERQGRWSKGWWICRCPKGHVHLEPEGCRPITNHGPWMDLMEILAIQPEELKEHLFKRLPVGQGLLHMVSSGLTAYQAKRWRTCPSEQRAALLQDLHLLPATSPLYPYWTNDPHLWLSQILLETTYLLQPQTLLIPWSPPQTRPSAPHLQRCYKALTPYTYHLPQGPKWLCQGQRTCWRDKQGLKEEIIEPPMLGQEPDSAAFNLDCPWQSPQIDGQHAGPWQRWVWQRWVWQQSAPHGQAMDSEQPMTTTYMGWLRSDLVVQRMLITTLGDVRLLRWLTLDHSTWAVCLLPKSSPNRQGPSPWPQGLAKPWACWQGDFRVQLPEVDGIEPFLASLDEAS